MVREKCVCLIHNAKLASDKKGNLEYSFKPDQQVFESQSSVISEVQISVTASCRTCTQSATTNTVPFCVPQVLTKHYHLMAE